MRRKKTKRTRPAKKENWWEKYKVYIIPSVIGAVIALFFSGSFGLGIAVFVAVWIGNWIGREYLAKKK